MTRSDTLKSIGACYLELVKALQAVQDGLETGVLDKRNGTFLERKLVKAIEPLVDIQIGLLGLDEAEWNLPDNSSST